MELQIQDLVASLRKDGIEAANREAEAIISEAKKKAEEIITAARAEADSEKEKAEKDIAILKENAKIGAEQAQRDAVLSFKAAVQREFEKILSAKVKENLSGKAMASLIKAAVSDEDMGKFTVEVSEASEEIMSELAAEIKSGLCIRPTKGVKAGFRLASRDGSGYFDCSDEEVMQMLAPYFRKIDF